MSRLGEGRREGPGRVGPGPQLLAPDAARGKRKPPVARRAPGGVPPARRPGDGSVRPGPGRGPAGPARGTRGHEVCGRRAGRRGWEVCTRACVGAGGAGLSGPAAGAGQVPGSPGHRRVYPAGPAGPPAPGWVMSLRRKSRAPAVTWEAQHQLWSALARRAYLPRGARGAGWGRTAQNRVGGRARPWQDLLP